MAVENRLQKAHLVPDWTCKAAQGHQTVEEGEEVGECSPERDKEYQSGQNAHCGEHSGRKTVAHFIAESDRHALAYEKESDNNSNEPLQPLVLFGAMPDQSKNRAAKYEDEVEQFGFSGCDTKKMGFLLFLSLD